MTVEHESRASRPAALHGALLAQGSARTEAARAIADGTEWPRWAARDRYELALLCVECELGVEALTVMATLEAPDASRLAPLLAEIEPSPVDSMSAPENHEDAAPAPNDAAGEFLDGADVPALVDPRVTPPDREAAGLFLEWLGGRRDLYAKQWYSPARRRGGYHPVEEPLDLDVAQAHLDGRLTAGQYLLFPDSTVSFAVLDLDVAPAALEAARASGGADLSPVEVPSLRRYLLAMLEVAGRLGVPVFAEDSGGRGAHLWVFFRPRRPARAARMLLSQLVQAAGAQPPDVSVEVFPKQDKPGSKGLSSLVKLPLGVHAATGRRCRMLDERLRPIESPLTALRRLTAIPDDTVAALLGRRLHALPAPELAPGDGPLTLATQPVPASLAEALRAVPAGPEERAACERMLDGCHVLRALVNKAYEQRRLDPVEARVLMYSIGLIGQGPGTIDDVLAAARVPRRELERVRRGVPAPVGCKRLRLLDREGASRCVCPKGELAQPYATPAVFAVGAQPPSAPAWKPMSPWIDGDALEQPSALAQVGEMLRRIEERLAALEEKK